MSTRLERRCLHAVDAFTRGWLHLPSMSRGCLQRVSLQVKNWIGHRASYPKQQQQKNAFNIGHVCICERVFMTSRWSSGGARMCWALFASVVFLFSFILLSFPSFGGVRCCEGTARSRRNTSAEQQHARELLQAVHSTYDQLGPVITPVFNMFRLYSLGNSQMYTVSLHQFVSLFFASRKYEFAFPAAFRTSIPYAIKMQSPHTFWAALQTWPWVIFWRTEPFLFSFSFSHWRKYWRHPLLQVR